MNASRFDALARALVATGSRRVLLGLLTALPLIGGIAALHDEVDAKKRRTKHHRDNGAASERKRRKKHKNKKKCKSKATVCAGKCGTVRYKCKKRKKKVNCGSCACTPPCGECKVCDAQDGVCVPDPQQFGESCGQPGQVCQSDGDCACHATSCPACATCQGSGECTAPCGGQGCCASGTCEQGTANGACGTDGAACAVCTLPQTCGGSGQTGVCGCTPTTCAAQGADCGEIEDDCGGTLNCGTCSNTTPICVNNICVPCSVENPCPDGCCAADGACQPGTSGNFCGADGTMCQACANPAPICLDQACAPCTSNPQCGSGAHCDGGSCIDCDVCADGCDHSTVQEAIDAADTVATIRICAGTFTRSGTDPVARFAAKQLTLIGAGAGSDGTILDGQAVESMNAVLHCIDSSTEVQQLTIRGARDTAGIVVESQATLTLTDVTVTENASGALGEAGGILNSGTLTLAAGTSVTGNDSGGAGGGATNFGTLTLDAGSTITSNTAGADGGGIFNSGDGTLTLNAGSRVSGNNAGADGGGISNFDGTVTLAAGSAVCGNSPDQCVGFADPNGACQDTCPA